ncbi:MAG: 3-dehydroquinate synthase [Planctomycetia bacterium]|nr:3-dehydroquinate synthase [Planctomycetia bacterium]
MGTVEKVALGVRSYDINIGIGFLGRIATYIDRLGDFSQLAVVTDTNVDRLYAEYFVNFLTNQGYEVSLFVVPAGETSKSAAIAEELWSGFLAAGLDRKALVIALGGGVVGDLSGYVASTFVRGLRFFQVPTTLLAQVDSSVGGKVAINIPHGKNMVGTFHQPIGVLIDPKTILTLNEVQYRTGLGEVLKYGVSLDAEFFDYLENHTEQIRKRDLDTLTYIVARCCRLKADIVEEDEKEEKGLRSVLNYGHTFAHAIESAAGYGKVQHGLAVSVGCIFAVKLANLLARKGDRRFAAVDEYCVDRQIRLYQNLQMPTTLRDLDMDHLTIEKLLELMNNDKKVDHRKIWFILPTRLGKCARFSDIELGDVEEILIHCKQKSLKGVLN